MLVGIVVFAVFMYPMVLGQSVEFEQECNILRTLEHLETRLQEQDARLKLQQTVLEQEKAHGEKQEALLEHLNASFVEQKILLGRQNGTLEKQGILLEYQNVTLVELETRLEQREAQIHELESQLVALNRSTKGQRIGFTAETPAHAPKSGVIRFIDVITNEGGGYNSSTGEFTCSVAGLYSFSLHLLKSKHADYVQCRISRNDIGLTIVYPNPPPTADDGFYSASTSAVVHLSPGDVVNPGACSAANLIYRFSSFSGFLIRAD